MGERGQDPDASSMCCAGVGARSPHSHVWGGSICSMTISSHSEITNCEEASQPQGPVLSVLLKDSLSPQRNGFKQKRKRI